MMVIATSIVKARLYPNKALVSRLYQFHASSSSSSSSSSPYRYFSAAVPPQNKNDDDDDDEQKFGFVESTKKLIIEKVVTPKNQFYMLGKVPLLHWESDMFMFRLIIRPYSLERFHFHFRLY
jgi:hypothetical protein